MEFSLTQERKNEILNQMKNQLEIELFQQLVYIGIDPDIFNIETYSEPEDAARAFEHQRVTDLVNRIKTISSKIS